MHFAAFATHESKSLFWADTPVDYSGTVLGGAQGFLTRKKSEPQPKIVQCTQIQKRLGLDFLLSSIITPPNVSFPVGGNVKGDPRCLLAWEPAGV